MLACRNCSWHVKTAIFASKRRETIMMLDHLTAYDGKQSLKDMQAFLCKMPNLQFRS